MGNPSDSQDRLTAEDIRIIKKKARRIPGHCGFTRSDVEDIEQELAMHVFKQTPRYRPELGSREKFVSKLVKNKLLNLMDQRRALKRDNHRDLQYEAVDEEALVDTKIRPEQIDLMIEVRDVLARLPQEVRQIALLRMQTNEAQIAKLTGKTRCKVRSALRQVGQSLRDAGLAPNSKQ